MQTREKLTIACEQAHVWRKPRSRASGRESDSPRDFRGFRV